MKALDRALIAALLAVALAGLAKHAADKLDRVSTVLVDPATDLDLNRGE